MRPSTTATATSPTAFRWEGTVDSSTVGEYTLTYTVADSFGNPASATRTVKVVPQTETIDPGDKVIYLTFDDGPSQYTAQLLDVLDKYGVKATFFVVNTGYTDLIADEYKRGHTVAVHTACHDYDTVYASEDAYFADFAKMQQIIADKTGGYGTTMFRFPGGSSNTVSRFNPGIMTRLTQDATARGLQYYDWNVSSGDAGETTSTDQVYQNVIDDAAATTSRSFCSTTSRASAWRPSSGSFSGVWQTAIPSLP